jgi:tetratricopeptide (TPR) repeat protein
MGSVTGLAGCSKKGDDTNTPGGRSKEDVEAEKAKAKATAKVNTLIVQANEALGAGRYVSARKIAEDALAENPDNADAYVVLGAAEWRAGDFDESTASLRKAMELDPKNFGGGVAFSRNLRAASQYQEALAVLEPVIAAEGDGFQASRDAEDCEVVAGWCTPPRSASRRCWSTAAPGSWDLRCCSTPRRLGRPTRCSQRRDAADVTNDDPGYADPRASRARASWFIEGETGSFDSA